MSTPTHLWQCHTQEDRRAWMERALRAGHVLSDAGLWLGGVDRPEREIAALREAGLSIATTRKRITDAAGTVHNDLAWRMEAP